jgi:hypothetical protein
LADDVVRAEAWSDIDPETAIDILVSQMTSDVPGEIQARTERIVIRKGATECHDLGLSNYRSP